MEIREGRCHKISRNNTIEEIIILKDKRVDKDRELNIKIVMLIIIKLNVEIVIIN